MSEVFISYKREERDAARRLAEALQKHGFSVWWDAELLPGEQYRAVTLEILQNCRAAIVIWSPRSIQSNWVLDEAQRALDRGVLVPVELEKVGAYPLGFGQLHAHDLTSWDGSADHEAIQPLFAAVRRLAGAPDAERRVKHSREEVETEVAFWRGIHESHDPADFETYLTRYPEGLFVELARRRADGSPMANAAPVKRRRPKASAARPPAAPLPAAPPPPTTSRPMPAAAPTLSSAPAPAPALTAHELAFIGVVVVVSAFIAWPIANSALGLERVFYGQDYELLFSLETPQNLIIMTPLLVALAWCYDRAKALAATRFSPLFVQYGALACLLGFFLDSRDMRQHDGRETQLAVWLLFVWAAASFARPAVFWLRHLIEQKSAPRS